MILRGHSSRIFIALFAVILCAERADAGFVASDSEDRLAVAAKSVEPPVAIPAQPKAPLWLQHLLVGAWQQGSGTMSSTGVSTVNTFSNLAAVTLPVMPLRNDSAERLAPERPSFYRSPDLGGLSPPPRFCCV